MGPPTCGLPLGNGLDVRTFPKRVDPNVANTSLTLKVRVGQQNMLKGITFLRKGAGVVQQSIQNGSQRLMQGFDETSEASTFVRAASETHLVVSHVRPYLGLHAFLTLCCILLQVTLPKHTRKLGIHEVH